MNTPLIIGITGGIGGGKSTLSDKLRAEGYDVYDSDMEARRLQNEHPQIMHQLKDLFGEDIYTSEGLNRKALAKIVFERKDLLTRLNDVVHPVVREDFKNWIADRLTHDLLFMESAILFETGFSCLVDKVIVITASEEVRLKRVLKRDCITPEQVHARMANQIPEDIKISKADFVIHSDDNLPLYDKMKKLLLQLEEIKKNKAF